MGRASDPMGCDNIHNAPRHDSLSSNVALL
jgi:hypothetical protein